MALYLIIQISAVLSRVVPRSWRYAIGSAVGDAVWLVWSRKRRIITRNMALILNEGLESPATRRVARQSLRNYCKYLIEFLELPVMSSADDRIANMTVNGLENLTSALARDQGVLLASAHFGTIEIPGIRLTDFTDFHAVYEPFKPAYLDRLIQRKRLEKGIELIAQTNVRSMMKVLRNGGTVALLFDRPVDLEKGVRVQFFGRDTAVPGGPALLALKTGATLIPVFTTREPDNTFTTTLNTPIACERTGDRDADIQAIMQRLMSALQQAVSLRPDQWYMFRSMWPPATVMLPAGSPSKITRPTT